MKAFAIPVACTFDVEAYFKRMAEFLRKHGSVKEQARRLGFSVDSIKNWRQGKAEPTLRAFFRMVACYGPAFYEFVTGESKAEKSVTRCIARMQADFALIMEAVQQGTVKGLATLLLFAGALATAFPADNVARLPTARAPVRILREVAAA